MYDFLLNAVYTLQKIAVNFLCCLHYFLPYFAEVVAGRGFAVDVVGLHLAEVAAAAEALRLPDLVVEVFAAVAFRLPGFADHGFVADAAALRVAGLAVAVFVARLVPVLVDHLFSDPADFPCSEAVAVFRPVVDFAGCLFLYLSVCELFSLSSSGLFVQQYLHIQVLLLLVCCWLLPPFPFLPA